MGLKHVSGPVLEPVTLDEAKLYVRVDGTAEDDQINLLITAARELFERETGLILLRQSWTKSLDAWPSVYKTARRRVFLPLRPVISVTSITVTDAAGTATVLPASDYALDMASEPPRVVEVVPGHWPAPGAAAAGIAIGFDAGYGDVAEDVPAAIRLALLKLIAEGYETRQISGSDPKALSLGVTDILAPFMEARL
jgi:uncharacterized phiE125 gp8 family phage protein